jgi:1-acyl-sn-glycerol-3-phosphate acyltransferase
MTIHRREDKGQTTRGARALATTVLLWIYFIGAFLAGYWVVFLVAGLLRGRQGLAWAQGSYSRGFFAWLGVLVPRQRPVVPSRLELRRAHGTIVVCNHLSFLDPLLLLSLLPRAITIVRPDLFRIPIFGWLLRGAGFLTPDLFAEGQPWLDRVAHHLRAGGNLLVFPEGTRSRDGSLAPFQKGAFYLARVLSAPVMVLRVRGTDRLFPPGRLLFDPSSNQSIELHHLATLTPADADTEISKDLADRVRQLYESDAPATVRTRPSC